MIGAGPLVFALVRRLPDQKVSPRERALLPEASGKEVRESTTENQNHALLINPWMKRRTIKWPLRVKRRK